MGPRGEPGLPGAMGPPGPQGPNGLSIPGSPVSTPETASSRRGDWTVYSPEKWDLKNYSPSNRQRCRGDFPVIYDVKHSIRQ